MSIENVTSIAAATKPHISYVNVNPETAARWLQSNTVNRNLRQAKVNQYARDMVAGRWNLSNDALCFDVDGKLLNGQHRLNAVIKSGQTVIFAVMRNVPLAAMTTMDSGSARSASDALGFQGEKSTALLASVVKQAINVANGNIYRDTKQQTVSHAEISDFLDLHPELRESVAATEKVRTRIDCPPTALGVAHWMISRRADRAAADAYLSRLASRASEPEGSPILAVDSRLREVRRSRNRYPTRNFIYLLIKGWNYAAEGRSVATLAITPKSGQQFRIPEPIRPRP